MNAQEKLAALDLELALEQIKNEQSQDPEKIHGQLDMAMEEFIKSVAPIAAHKIDMIKLTAKWWASA